MSIEMVCLMKNVYCFLLISKRSTERLVSMTLAREGHELLTSAGFFQTFIDNNGKLVIVCQRTWDRWTSQHVLSITWAKGTMPPEKDILINLLFTNGNETGKYKITFFIRILM